jgi:hypothetical protein
VIEAYPTPPTFRVAEKKTDSKRRSVDFTQLLGSVEDVGPEDPVFVLKRAVAYRSSRNRSSAPLDDVALQHLRRDIAASEDRQDAPGQQPSHARQMSKQELIAAQRAASRANQKAILSAQANSVRGVDVLLPGNALLRSQRSGADDRMRYSYVDGAGEMYDISDIVEEEWAREFFATARAGPGERKDLLEGVVGKAQGASQEALGEKLDRVLSKIRPETRMEPPPSATGSTHSVSSTYSSMDEEAIRKPPQSAFAAAQAAAAAERVRSPVQTASRAMSPALASARSPTPTQVQAQQRVISPAPTGPAVGSRSTTPVTRVHGRTQSTTSHASAPGPSPTKSNGPTSRAASSARSRPPVPFIGPDDFGVSHMLALLQVPVLLAKPAPPEPLDAAEKMLFGRSMDEVKDLHPDVREIYKGTFENLKEMDKVRPPMFLPRASILIIVTDPG